MNVFKHAVDVALAASACVVVYAFVVVMFTF